jgi:hypothetical protein
MFNALATFMKSDNDVKTKAVTDAFTGTISRPYALTFFTPCVYPFLLRIGYSMQKSLGFETFQFRSTNDPDFKWPENPPQFEALAKKYPFYPPTPSPSYQSLLF